MKKNFIIFLSPLGIISVTWEQFSHDEELMEVFIIRFTPYRGYDERQNKSVYDEGQWTTMWMKYPSRELFYWH